MTADTSTMGSACVRVLHNLVVHAVIDADAPTLREVVNAVLGNCLSERETAERSWQDALEWKDTGDTVQQALCEQQACSRHTAAEYVEDVLLSTLGLWDRYEEATASLPEDEPFYLPTVISEQAETTPVRPEDVAGGGS